MIIFLNIFEDITILINLLKDTKLNTEIINNESINENNFVTKLVIFFFEKRLMKTPKPMRKKLKSHENGMSILAIILIQIIL